MAPRMNIARARRARFAQHTQFVVLIEILHCWYSSVKEVGVDRHAAR